MAWRDTWKQIKRFNITVHLGSRYSVEDDRKLNRERLKQFCERIVVDIDELPEGGITHCNRALRAAAIQIAGYTDFPVDMLMNDMIDKIVKDSNFKKDTLERGWDHACKGGWAIVVKKYPVHGHGATIAPSESMFDSPSWGKVPMVANVGKTNGIMPLSHAFPVKEGQPDCFLFGAV